MTDAPKHSQPFTDMAERIDRVTPADYGGAYVVAFPGEAPITGVLVAMSDYEALLGQLKARIEMAMSVRQPTAQGFARR